MDSIVEENGNSSNNKNSSNNIDETTVAAKTMNTTTISPADRHHLGMMSPQAHQQQQTSPARSVVSGSVATNNISNTNNSQINVVPSSVSVPMPVPVAVAPPPPPPAAQLAVSVSAAAALAASAVAGTVLTTNANVVQYLSSHPHGLPVQSVIQAANQSSVIQTAAGTNTQTPVGITKAAGVLYVNKPNTTVIHTTSGNAVQLPPHFPCKIKPEPNTQHLDTNSEDSFTDEDSPRGRRELTRRPSYNKIYSEISGPDITAGTNLQMSENCNNSNNNLPALATGTMSATAGTTLIHLPPENPTSFYLPNRMSYNSNNNVVAEDQSRKREIRLQKNREAARECRRKKKEYIKCLENRVAVLENQNKALIEELKSLKELYCQTKNDCDKPQAQMPALTQSHIQKLPPIQPLRILENVKNFQNDGDSEGNGGSNRNSDNTNSNSNSSSIINMKEIVYEPNLIEIASNAIQYTNNAVTAAMAAANDGEDDEEEAEIEVEAEMVDVNVKGDEVQGVIIYEEIMLDDDNVYDETTEKSIQRVTTFSSPPLPSISSSSSTSCTYVSPHFVTANYNATSIPSTVIITNDGRNMNKEKYFLLRQALAKDYATTTTATTTTLTKTTTTKNGISCIQIITKPSLAQENDAIYE